MSEQSLNGQTVGQLGEFALIDAIAARLAKSSAETVSVGIGDDSAVVSAKGGNVVACIDMLTQGVHFRLDWSEAKDIVLKSLRKTAGNFEDFYEAKSARFQLKSLENKTDQTLQQKAEVIYTKLFVWEFLK
jgi:hypothetical protein